MNGAETYTPGAAWAEALERTFLYFSLGAKLLLAGLWAPIEALEAGQKQCEIHGETVLWSDELRRTHGDW